MIRGTKNEGISSLTKKRHEALGLIGGGIGGESLEAVHVIATGEMVERADAVSDHTTTVSDFPTDAFNGTFE